MDEIINWIRPVLGGLMGGFIVWVMLAFTKEESKREGHLRHLHYGKPFRVFAVLIVPFAVFVVYAVSQSYKGQEVPAFLVAAGFIAGAIILPYQVFLVRLSYDDEFVYYQTPLMGKKQAPWSNLLDVAIPTSSKLTSS